jgi:hypothetical protein
MAGIDRDFWLDYAKNEVTKSIESREAAAEKLDTFLAWIWTIYTSIFALASLFNYMSSNVWQLLVVSQPILIIMVARFFCKWVEMPTMKKDEKADPNVVPEIIDSFKATVEDKKRKLSIALVFTVISMISICVALIGYSALDPDKEIKKENSRIKLINDNKDIKFQNSIKSRMLDDLTKKDFKHLDSIKNYNK